MLVASGAPFQETSRSGAWIWLRPGRRVSHDEASMLGKASAFSKRLTILPEKVMAPFKYPVVSRAASCI